MVRIDSARLCQAANASRPGFLQQLFLAGEVAVHRHGREAGRGADGAQAEGLDAAAFEFLQGACPISRCLGYAMYTLYT